MGHRTYALAHNWDLLREWGHGVDVVAPYAWYRAHGGALGLEPTPDWYVAHLVELVDGLVPKLRPAPASGSTWATPTSPAGRASAPLAARGWGIRPACAGAPPWAATARRSSC